jgi:signal peptidase II
VQEARGARPVRASTNLSYVQSARALPVLLGTAAIVVAVDQATKEIAVRSLSDGPVDLIEGILTLRLTFNSGGAFGLLQGRPGLFLAASLLIAVVILLWARNLEHRSWALPLGFILGGGLGNVADRLFRPYRGHVVDFVDLHVWPVFNVADSAIVIGVCLLFWLSARPKRPAADRAGADLR